MPSFQKFRVTKLFAESTKAGQPFWSRINDNLLMRKPTIIVICGGSQTGKTTIGRWIAKTYDKNFRIFWTLEDWLEYFNEMKDHITVDAQGLKHVPPEYQHRWLVFEEPQNEVPKQQFWSERNLAINSIASGFGFLKNHLILPTPTIAGLSSLLFTSVTMRMDVKSKLSLDKKSIIRKAYIKLPYWSDYKNKYIWIGVEDFTIPVIADDVVYDSDKVNNWFWNQLPKLETKLGTGITNEKTISTEKILKLLVDGIVDGEWATDELEKQGYSPTRADLLVMSAGQKSDVAE